jgi:alpha-1,2-mannosyltransferase
LLAFIGFLPIIGTFRPMSLFSANFHDVSRAGSSDQTPIEELYAKLTVAAAVFFIVLEIAYLVTAGLPPIAKPWVDGTDFVFGRDFLNTWMGGRSAFFGGPAPWFNLVTYNEAIQQMLGTYYQDHYWSYPPHIMLFIWPFGLMPYLPAYIAWCVIGIGLYLFACSSAIPRERLLFLAVAPGITVCVFFGQNGFYTSALLIGGLLCLDRRPVLAGVLFGILTIKPQIGMLLPILLLLEERWLTIVSAAVTTAVLIVLTSMLFGWDIWIEFWYKVLPQQQALMETGGGVLYAVVSSVFFSGRMLDLPLEFDWAAQWSVSALAFLAVVWTFWKRRDPALSLALFVTATFLFTPYILNYDMVAFGFVVAHLRERPDNTMGDHYLMIAVWSLPVTMMLATVIWLPLAPIVLITFAGRLLWRLAYSSTREVKTLPGDLSPASA